MSDGPPRRPLRPFEPLPEWAHLGTRLAHGGRRPERNAGAVTAPIYQTASFQFPEAFSDARDGGDAYLYSRHGNPTQELAAELIRAAEDAEAARVFGSGMGAMSAVLLALAGPGTTVAALEDVYGGTSALLETVLARWGVRTVWIPLAEADRPEVAIPEGTAVVLAESPTNPFLRVIDLERWARAAHDRGAVFVVDNTFATPINQNPIHLGADLVTHSATKYLGGHDDLVAGAVAGARAVVERVDPVATLLGSVLDPFAAFLLARGLRTLELRVDRQNANAAAVVAALEGHPALGGLHYPGRAGPGDEAIARRQMRGRGGVVTLELRDGKRAADRFLQALRLADVAPSLGSTSTLVSRPEDTSHALLTPVERSRRGITPGTVRLALGVEDPEDLIRDLTEALDAAARKA